MYDDERENRRLYVASFGDDIPRVSRGDLIPRRAIYSAPQFALRTPSVWYTRPIFLLVFSFCLCVLSFGTLGYSLVAKDTLVASPLSAAANVATMAKPPLQFGMALVSQEQDPYLEAKAEALSSGESFIDIDLVAGNIVFWEDAFTEHVFPIVFTPATDSWWYSPGGVYTVEDTHEEKYSTFANMYLPWAVSFGGNIGINGIPRYQDGVEAPPSYEGGGIRLKNEDAEVLYHFIQPDMQVLIRDAEVVSDSFLYQAKVPDIGASHYLIADLDSSTVLAASDLHARAPIASITKLMTALVAAEYIDLDARVPIRNNPSSYVTSLIPRLESSNSASMYSLLQLLLMESSNEAAEVIASVLGRETFIKLMNDHAVAIGLTNTTFADPSGLSADNISTVHDLFRLVQYIEQNRGFILDLTAEQHLPTAYTNGEFGILENFNALNDVGFTAGKIGETTAAGMTSVTLHTITVRGVERHIAVVLLNTDDRKQDIADLITFVEERFE